MEGAVNNAMTQIGTVVTSVTGWMGNIVSTITAEGNEIMLLSIGIFVVGAAIGLAGRLIGR